MADDSVVASIEGVQRTRFAYLTPESKDAQRSLALVGDRHRSSRSSIEPMCPLSAPSALAAKSKYRFCLSFNKSGTDNERNWILGKGSPRFPVNLQLCPPKSRLLIGPLICKISLHPQSGAFVLKNISQNHSIEYLEAGVVLQYQQKHVLFMKRNHLRFGPLHYILEFDAENDAGFALGRARHMRDLGYSGFNPPCPFLDALPKPTHVRIGDLILHQSISSGTFGVVRVGVHLRSGEIVACKTIHCERRNAISIKSEIILASEMTLLAGVVPLIDAWCEHGHPFPCLHNKIEDVHLSMPYARYDFDSAPWPEISLSTRLTLFWQVLTGLSNLHSAGIMHRDISPRNLLIFSLDNPAPKAVICDFGKSIKGARGKNTHLGPPSYTAPEVCRGEGYTNAIDVFSLGLSILRAFHIWPITDRIADRIDENGHEAVLEQLTSLREQGHIPEGLGALLRAMLSWDPADRPTAKQALDHEFWQGITATAPSLKRPGSGISSESGTAAGSWAKRMRRSDGQSPESPPESIRGEE